MLHPGIVAAIAAVALFATTIGISYPLLSLVLDRAGLSPTFIGANAAMAPVGFLVSAPLIPWAAARFGAVRLAICGAAATGIVMSSFAVITDPYAWFMLRFLLGVSVNVLFVLSETWINQLAPAHLRGRIVATYVTVISAGFAAGPFLVGIFGTRGLAPFLVALAGSLLAVPILHRARGHLPPFPASEASGIVPFVRAAPMLLAIVAAVALFDQTTLALVPIYALRSGLAESVAAVTAGVLVAGNVLAQMPIGWLADVWPRRRVAALLVALVVLGAALLPLTSGTDLLWPLLFVWGGAGYGIYTVTVAELGARFTGAMLLSGNAAFSLMWGFGGLAGPPAAGAVMDLIGPDGLPLTLALLFTALAVLIVLRPLSPAPAGI
jgi:MFS family permease